MTNTRHLIRTMAIMAVIMLFFVGQIWGQCEFTVTDGQPFIEDFEGDQFECWTIETVGGGNWTTMEGSTTTLAAFSFTSAGDEARLISPVLDISGVDGATFSFSYAMMGLYQTDELVVSYRSSETDSWHTLGSYSISDYQNFYEETFTLTNLSATYQISFLGRGLGGYMIFVDNIEIMGTGGCPRPVSLQATEITAFAAQLGWSVSGNEQGWVIDFDGQIINTDTQPYRVDNLDPQTEYTFTVKAICGGGAESEWAIPVSFETLCDVIVVTDDEPYYDDFESSDDFVCWMNEIVSGTDKWVVDPGYLYPNNTAFFIWLGGEARLISAPLDLTAVSNPALTFKHKQPGLSYGAGDQLKVGYRTNENDIWHILADYDSTFTDWEEESLSLPNPSATYQIAFIGIGHNAEGVYVDDVMVGQGYDGIIDQQAVVASVSPNPTTGIVKIETNVAEADITVFDMLGKQIVCVKAYEGQADIDLSRCDQGVYMARISSETGIVTVKLVKE